MTAAGRCSPPADPCKTDGVSPLPRPPGILKARTEYFCTGFFHRVSFSSVLLVCISLFSMQIFYHRTRQKASIFNGFHPFSLLRLWSIPSPGGGFRLLDLQPLHEPAVLLRC